MLAEIMLLCVFQNNYFMMKNDIFKESFLNNKVNTFEGLIEHMKYENEYQYLLNDFLRSTLTDHFFEYIETDILLLIKSINKNTIESLIRILSDVINLNSEFEGIVQSIKEINQNINSEHCSPDDISELCSKLLINHDATEVNDIYILDICCGFGNFLLHSFDELNNSGGNKKIFMQGCDINKNAIIQAKLFSLFDKGMTLDLCSADILVNDPYENLRYRYIISAPPMGMSWKYKNIVMNRYENLPRVSDSSFLFIQNIVSKMHNDEIGSKAIILTNPSIFKITGKGEENIRLQLLKDDLIECIIVLPDSLLFNTSIQLCILVLNNRKQKNRQGKVQIINASTYFTSTGRAPKRKLIDKQSILDVVNYYHDYKHQGDSFIFNNSDFIFRKIRFNIKNTEKNKSIEKTFPISADVDRYFERHIKISYPNADYIEISNSKCVIDIQAIFKTKDNYYENFQNSIDSILDIIKSLKLENELQESYFFRMIYSNVITSLEVYLEDTFKFYVFSDEKYLREFVRTFRDIDKEKIDLKRIFESYDNLKQNMTKRISEIMFHNIKKISGMYQDTLKVKFNDLSELCKIVDKRHDMVHRNGKDKNGKQIAVSKNDIEDVIKLIYHFVNDIERQLSELDSRKS